MKEAKVSAQIRVNEYFNSPEIRKSIDAAAQNLITDKISQTIDSKIDEERYRQMVDSRLSRLKTSIYKNKKLSGWFSVDRIAKDSTGYYQDKAIELKEELLDHFGKDSTNTMNLFEENSDRLNSIFRKCEPKFLQLSKNEKIKCIIKDALEIRDKGYVNMSVVVRHFHALEYITKSKIQLFDFAYLERLNKRIK